LAVGRLPAGRQAGSSDWSAAQLASSSASTNALPMAAALAASGGAALGRAKRCGGDRCRGFPYFLNGEIIAKTRPDSGAVVGIHVEVSWIQAKRQQMRRQFRQIGKSPALAGAHVQQFETQPCGLPAHAQHEAGKRCFAVGCLRHAHSLRRQRHCRVNGAR
jgi:hypothetical protein